ncbi:taste receptor type 2 member 123-like [Pithys albifrons albifrons]|uniref:taste receptor type 2 member 123-like n=1 Tax=Pithys albifrons albifrons TaxID=3385563 RepID=UPI003A5CF864
MEACDSPEQSNVTFYGATAVAIFAPQAFAGMWINAFIVSVICNAWVKKKALNSNEKILLSLGCSRFWYLGIAWLYYLVVTIHPYCFYVSPLLELLSAVDGAFQCLNTWFSACLCVFYCIKIANFRNRFFNYLKVKIDRIVPWLLSGSLPLALVFGIAVYNTTDKTQCENFNFTSHGNYFIQIITMDEHFSPAFFIIVFVYVTALMAVMFSALLLLLSLWRHKRNMQTNSMKDLSMDAHIKAMKCILSFLVMYIINFIIMILALIYSMKNQIHMTFPISVVMYAFQGVDSLILIFINPKLEKTLLRILPCVKCRICMR